MKNENLIIAAKLAKLQEFIEIDMISGKKSGIKNTKKSFKFKCISVVLSSLITITLGLTLDDKLEYNGLNIVISLKNCAVVLSAILTGISAWDAFANYTSRSQQESSIVNKLNMLYKDISLYLEENEDCKESEYENFKSRYNKIHEDYSQDREAPKKKEPEKKEDV
ncbi:SLATT domain-containing protein [Paenibacillus sp. Z3-2]